MKRGSLALVMCMVAACAPADEPTTEAPSTAADEAAIREQVGAWDAAFNARDLEALVSLYEDDVVRKSPNQPPTIGKDALRAAFSEGWAIGDPRPQNEVVDVMISGDLAVVRGIYSATNVTPDGGRTEDRGAWLSAVRRQSDGSWKNVWDSWSSDLPASSAE